MFVLGIDPGMGGALAFYDSYTRSLELFDMPVWKVKGKNQINFYELARIVDERTIFIDKAYIERVNSQPKWGAKSSFNFGKAAGAVEMVCAAYFIPTELITPNVWKKSFNLLKKEKAASRQLATQHFPEHAGEFSRLRDDGRAEAALIAIHGVRNEGA